MTHAAEFADAYYRYAAFQIGLSITRYDRIHKLAHPDALTETKLRLSQRDFDHKPKYGVDKLIIENDYQVQ